MSAFIIENIIPSSRRLEFISTRGDSLVVNLIGDCCSLSYFDPASCLDVESLMGETLMDIESNETRSERDVDGAEKRIHYALIVRTDKQSVSLMWRNDSNGYYSGWTEIQVNGVEVNRYDGSTVAQALVAVTS